MEKRNFIKRISVIFVLLLLVVLIGYTSTYSNNTSTAENKIGKIISPVQKVFFNIGRVFSNSYDSIVGIYKMREENQQLKEKIYELSNENITLKDIIEREEYLKNEYIMKKALEYDYIKSQIISRDPNNWFQKFTVDKGIKDRVKIDDIVVHGAKINENLTVIGLVGKVIDVGDNWAKVISITDINSSLSFRNIKNNASGILKGQIDNTIKGYTFSKEESVEVGDILLTSGLGEIYIKDIYIGKVGSVEKKEGLTNNIVLEPVVNFDELYDVYILRIDR